MTHRYSVMLDSITPTIEVSEDSNMSFMDACKEIIDYATQGKYLIQQKRWEQILDAGEEAFLEA